MLRRLHGLSTSSRTIYNPFNDRQHAAAKRTHGPPSTAKAPFDLLSLPSHLHKYATVAADWLSARPVCLRAAGRGGGDGGGGGGWMVTSCDRHERRLTGQVEASCNGGCYCCFFVRTPVLACFFLLFRSDRFRNVVLRRVVQALDRCSVVVASPFSDQECR